jgi:hypothetical protein
MHEVLAGDIYQPQAESVPEQAWSSAGFLSSALQGLFGLEVNDEEKSVTLAPHIPLDWPEVTLSGVKIEKQNVNFTLRQELGFSSVRIEAPSGPIHIRLAPQIPLGARLESATVCGRRATVQIETHDQDVHAILDFVAPRGSCDVSMKYRDGVAITMPPARPSLGNPSTSAQLTSLHLDESSLLLDVDVIPNVENKVWIRTQRRVESAVSANLHRIDENLYELDTPVNRRDSVYKHLQISVKFTP